MSFPSTGEEKKASVIGTGKISPLIYRERLVQYTRTESGRLFGEDDPSSGSWVVVFAEVKYQEVAI